MNTVLNALAGLQPNREQIKSFLRWVLTTFGSGLDVHAAEVGWGEVDTQIVLGAAATIISFSWGMVAHKRSHAIAVVDAMPTVEAVITKASPEGRAAAAANPSPTVVSADNPSALAIVKAARVT